MTRLAVKSEIEKLAAVLRVPPARLQFLGGLHDGQIRHFRGALCDLFFDENRPLFRMLAAAARWFPGWFTALLARFWLGPVLVARVAGEMAARHAAKVIKKLPPAFVAESAQYMDPRRLRDMMGVLPTEVIVAVGTEVRKRRDFMTIGKFADIVPDEAMLAILDTMEDEGELVEVAFYLESKNRLDHLVRVLPPERARKAILILRDRSRRPMWHKILALVSHVGYALKRELGDLGATQGEDVLNAIFQMAQEEDLWEDMIPVMVCQSPDVQRMVVNQPSFRQPAILENFLKAAETHGLWPSVLPLMKLMGDEARAALAPIAARLPHACLEHIAYAALVGEHWETALDIASRMSPEGQLECLQIVGAYGVADPELLQRLAELARSYGMGDIVDRVMLQAETA